MQSCARCGNRAAVRRLGGPPRSGHSARTGHLRQRMLRPDALSSSMFSTVRLNRPTTALFSGHGLALRLHQTLPAVEGIPTAFRLTLGSRNQARRLSVVGAPGWWPLRLRSRIYRSPRR